MFIEICGFCSGSGRDPRMSDHAGPSGRCPVCKAGGYPPGYTPPAREAIIAYAFPDWKKEAPEGA